MQHGNIYNGENLVSGVLELSFDENKAAVDVQYLPLRLFIKQILTDNEENRKMRNTRFRLSMFLIIFYIIHVDFQCIKNVLPSLYLYQLY